MGLFGDLRQQIEIQRIIAVFKEGAITPVTTLGYVARDAGKDEPGKASAMERDLRRREVASIN